MFGFSFCGVLDLMFGGFLLMWGNYPTFACIKAGVRDHRASSRSHVSSMAGKVL